MFNQFVLQPSCKIKKTSTVLCGRVTLSSLCFTALLIPLILILVCNLHLHSLRDKTD